MLHLKQLLPLRILVCPILVVWCGFAWTQQNTLLSQQTEPIDEQNQPSPKEITERLNHAKSIFEVNFSESIKIVEENLALAIQYGYTNEEALALTLLGEFQISLQNDASAVRHLKKANLIYKQQNNNVKSIITYRLLGDAYARLKQSELAIQNWEKAIILTSHQKTIIQLQLKIGHEYILLKEKQSAKIAFEKALRLSNEVGDEEGQVNATIGLGKVEEMSGSNIVAEQLFQSANQQATAMNSVSLTNSSLNSLSNLYRNSKNKRKRKQIQEETIDFNNSIGNSEVAIINSTEMANELIEEGNDDEAIEVLTESEAIVKQQENSEAKLNFYKTLSKAYEANGDTKKAEELDQEYSVLMDSFKVLEAQKNELISARNDIIQNTETKISLLEKDREISEKTIELLRQKEIIKDESIKSQKTIMIFLVIGIVLVGVLVFFIVRSNQQKQRNNQLLTLKSLRNQMNPHFIFNSLNSVNVYIAQQDERSANKYLTDFSKLMRSVLNYSQNDFISLFKEVEILELYLNLEHDRFKESFDYTINCPNSIDLEAYQIPPMLLQPIIENAIWHGLRYKEGKGFLKVDFKEVIDGLTITITDNGIGRDQSLKHKTANQLKMKSTGIKNVKDRLEIIKTAFKKELSIHIEDLNPQTKEGTKVTILLKT